MEEARQHPIMSDKSVGPFSAKLDVGAKAEAKFELKGEIPPSSIGKMLDALTDVLRPFSEKRGLKADQIRLQREEVAIAIARLARERIAFEGATAHPVDSKILIPLIEKSSQENIEDLEMIEKWANLLASSSMQLGSHPRFVQILSEITSAQAIMLDKIAENAFDKWKWPLRELEDAEATLDVSFLRRSQSNPIHGKHFKTDELLMQAVRDFFNRPGCLLYNVLYFNTYGDLVGDDFVENGHEIAFSLNLCSSLGLLKDCLISFKARVGRKTEELEIRYYLLTQIGVELIKTCSRKTVQKLIDAEDKNNGGDKEIK